MKKFRLKTLQKFVIFVAVLIMAGALFSNVRAENPPATSSLLIKMASGLSEAEQAGVIAADGGVEISSIPALGIHVVEVPAADLAVIIQNYQNDSRVVSVDENKTRKAEGLPSDTYYGYQWALTKIGWDSVFGTVTPAGTTTVAILDTGVDASHPDLSGKVIPGTSILDGSDGMSDPNGHGTWMAGITAANTDNLAGIAGVGYLGVNIMPVAVLGVDGTGRDSDIIAGILYAVDHSADVILMGFSNPGYSQNLQDAIDYAWAHNVVLVASTGNDAMSDPTYPAGDRGVIGVSSTDANDALSSFSNYGSDISNDVFLAAPGEDIVTTDFNDQYATISGTSASAAIVAGAAGFMKAVDPTLTNGIIVGRLARTADPTGTQEQTGNGRVNIANALADTGTDPIQPAGAPGGGPYVGQYVAASYHLDSVDSPSTTEGNSGTKTMTFHVTVSGSNQATTLYWRTMDGTAMGGTSCAPGIDYLSVSQLAGEAKSANFTIDVTICGDTTIESDETFTLQVADNSGFSGAGGNRLQTGRGTIQNDDADSTPPVITPNISGPQGNNAWYTGDVTVTWTVTDAESTITSTTGCGSTTITTDTTGTTLTCSATSAGGTNSQSVTIKRDATPPTGVSGAPNRTADHNGWYNHAVDVVFSGTDDTSGIDSCTTVNYAGPDSVTASANGTCTDNAGNTSSSIASSTFKYDGTGPTAELTVTAGTAGTHGWYTSDVTVHTSGSDSVSGIESCTGDQFQTSETTGAVFNGSCTNDAGLTTNATPLTIKLDKTPPTLNVTFTPDPIILNGSATASPNATDSISGVDTQSCGALDTSSVGSKTVSCTAADNAGNHSSQDVSYSVVYASGGMCLGSPGHAILQPINVDGSSIFKQKSTVPAKFRVCDANGFSIGTPGVVSSFRLYQTVAGTVSADADDAVVSTTPDSMFRWSSIDQQWIFNMNTKNLAANVTYFYRITLNDGTSILFNFGLK